MSLKLNFIAVVKIFGCFHISMKCPNFGVLEIILLIEQCCKQEFVDVEINACVL